MNRLDSENNDENQTQKSYLDYLMIIGKVIRDKCWWSLFNFDLFEKVNRIYPEENSYDWRRLLEDPDQVLDNLYLGSAFNAADYKWLKSHQIEIIVNVTSGISNFYPEEFTYYQFPAEDLDSGSLRNYYQSFHQLVLKHPEAKILVHCFAGRSRSASLVIYHLARHYQMSYEEALAFLKLKRSLINLNQEFATEIQERLLQPVEMEGETEMEIVMETDGETETETENESDNETE